VCSEYVLNASPLCKPSAFPNKQYF